MRKVISYCIWGDNKLYSLYMTKSYINSRTIKHIVFYSYIIMEYMRMLFYLTKYILIGIWLYIIQKLLLGKSSTKLKK